VSPPLFAEWAEAIEPMPLDEYAALLALLADMIIDVEAVISDAEAACDVEAARGGGCGWRRRGSWWSRLISRTPSFAYTWRNGCTIATVSACQTSQNSAPPRSSDSPNPSTIPTGSTS
jgi:hypothetical protein